MKYDDASWHYGGDFPKKLPEEAAATHIGMFVSWCMLNGLAGELFTEECPEDLEALKTGEMNPGEWFINNCDEKFTDEDLNELGNEFAAAYFDFDNGEYLNDYESLVAANFESLYFVPDSWETYNKLEPTITNRYQKWLAQKS
jgi:hypothetical protein